MAKCYNCLFYDKSYDDFRQEYDDVIKIGDDQPPKHYCSMYDSNIPADIFYKEAACPFFVPKVLANK